MNLNRRLIFIPGLGEDETIFHKIHPSIPGEKVFLNKWVLLGNNPRPGLTVLQFAQELVDQFTITREDVIIGHSTGGWVAYHIKHLVHCPIIQIASWTEEHKVVKPISNRHLIYLFVRKGLYFNPLVKRLLIWGKYRNKPSRKIFSEIFDNLIKGNKNNVVNQLRLIFNPVKEKITVKPDLRIHARADSIIRVPDQPFQEVPGDHFSLYTHPEKVYAPIIAFLQVQAGERIKFKQQPFDSL
jgi:hypothetical protein